MVYMNISVKNIEEAVNFYSEKLGIFEFQQDRRLICNVGIELIVDLIQCDTEEHCRVFGQTSHVKSSFRIAPNDEDYDSEIYIMENLKKNHVKYKETKDLGGHSLAFIDPSGNDFLLCTNFEVIK